MMRYVEFKPDRCGLTAATAAAIIRTVRLGRAGALWRVQHGIKWFCLYDRTPLVLNDVITGLSCGLLFVALALHRQLATDSCKAFFHHLWLAYVALLQPVAIVIHHRGATRSLVEEEAAMDLERTTCRLKRCFSSLHFTDRSLCESFPKQLLAFLLCRLAMIVIAKHILGWEPTLPIPGLLLCWHWDLGVNQKEINAKQQ